MKKLLCLFMGLIISSMLVFAVACDSDDTTGGKEQPSKIPTIPEGKNMQDVQITAGESLSDLLAELNISELNDSGDLSYQFYTAQNYMYDKVTDSSTSEGSEVGEYVTNGKFLKSAGKTYANHSFSEVSSDKDTWYYKGLNSDGDTERSWDISLEISLLDGLGKMRSTGERSDTVNGEKTDTDINNFRFVKDEKIDGIGDFENAYWNFFNNNYALYSGCMSFLVYALDDYLYYISDQYYYARWGSYDLTNPDSQLVLDMINMSDVYLGDYVDKYDVVLKKGDGALFVDITRTINIELSSDYVYGFEDKMVIYIDGNAGNAPSDFTDLQISDEEKATPGYNMSPDEITQKFENGAEINLGKCVYNNRIDIELQYEGAMDFYGITCTLNEDGSTTIPSGEYQRVLEYAAQAFGGEFDPSRLEYMMNIMYYYDSGDVITYNNVFCYSDNWTDINY